MNYKLPILLMTLFLSCALLTAPAGAQSCNQDGYKKATGSNARNAYELCGATSALTFSDTLMADVDGFAIKPEGRLIDHQMRVFNECWVVRDRSTNIADKDVFVPARTLAEWRSFVKADVWEKPGETKAGARIKVSINAGAGCIGDVACTGTVPQNAQLCPDDDTGLSAATGITLVSNSSSCAAPKCQYFCPDGFTVSNGNCVDSRIHINSCIELQMIGRGTNITGCGTSCDKTNYPADGQYVLDDNIDCSVTRTWNSGDGFKSLAVSYFNGKFDGAKKAISGLYMRNGTGLFWGISNGGQVSNLGLIDVDISGNSSGYVGGLAGYCLYSTIANVYVTGTLSNPIGLGGLCFQAAGATISNSYVSGTVSSQGMDHIVGGLIGIINAGTRITNSYTAGSVSGLGNGGVGGLVGSSSDGGPISNSYSTARVQGGASATGGLIGSGGTAIFSNSYWNSETADVSKGCGTSCSSVIPSKTNAQMSNLQMPSNEGGFTGWTFGLAGWKLDTIAAPAGTKFPCLSWQDDASCPSVPVPQVCDPNSATITAGTGSQAYPYQICACRQFSSIPANSNKNYVLTQDIDCTGVSFNILNFTGKLDGKDFTIRNYTSTVGSMFSGLFQGILTHVRMDRVNVTSSGPGLGGFVMSGPALGSVADSAAGEISYCSITNGNVGGSVYQTHAYTGGFVGQNAPAITHSSYEGVVYGADFTGGLVGGQARTISNSYVKGTVSNGPYVGGLVGSGATEITNSYFSGSVTGSFGVGGLVGSYFNVVNNSYAKATILATQRNAGGLVGREDGPEMNRSFFQGSVMDGSGWQSGAIHGYYDYGTTYTDVKYSETHNLKCILMNQDLSGCSKNTGGEGYWFNTTVNQPMASWDFTNTWQAVKCNYPRLQNVPGAQQWVAQANCPAGMTCAADGDCGTGDTCSTSHCCPTGQSWGGSACVAKECKYNGNGVTTEHQVYTNFTSMQDGVFAKVILTIPVNPAPCFGVFSSEIRWGGVQIYTQSENCAGSACGFCQGKFFGVFVPGLPAKYAGGIINGGYKYTMGAARGYYMPGTAKLYTSYEVCREPEPN